MQWYCNFLAVQVGQMKGDFLANMSHELKMSGLEIWQRLRVQEIEAPIIMQTARGASSDVAFGLKLGAEDYIAKPFDVGELLARIEAVLRRTNRQPSGQQIARIGNVDLDFLRLRATRTAKTSISAHGLSKFSNCSSNTRVKSSPANSFSTTSGANTPRFIHERSTRISPGYAKKIEPNPADPQFIVTVHRAGYRLVGY